MKERMFVAIIDCGEHGYRSAMTRGGTWLASALINHVSFSPSIVEIESVEDIRRWAGGAERLQVVTVSNVSGRVMGIKLDPALAAEAWRNGVQPRLV